MTYEYKLPSLGDGITGKITKILVKPGDTVSIDQKVLDVATDKVDAEITIDVAGIVEEVLVKIGDDVDAGHLLLRIKTTHETAQPLPAPAPAPTVASTIATPAASSKSIHEFKLPSLGDGVIGKVTEIFVKVGDQVKKDQNVLVVATDKVDAEMPIDADGIVEAIMVSSGTEVKEGMILMRIASSTVTTSIVATPPPPMPQAAVTQVLSAASPTASATAPTTSSQDRSKLRTSPLARKRAQEFGVNLSDVQPTDGSSRISYKDVVDFVKNKITVGGGAKSISTPSMGTLKQKALPDFTKFGEIDRKAQDKVAILTAEAMHYSTSTIPHAYISEKADITKMEALRQQYKEQVKAAGGGLTMTSIVAKAVAIVLKKMPQFNASLDTDTNELILKKYVNVGIAVDTPTGLYVPNIKNIDKKNLTEISIDLTDISTRAKSKKLTGTDLVGGTFTISNIGGIGGTNMLSIINWPEVAILSLVASRMEPVWNENTKTFEPRLMMPMTIGWDHRAINGGDAARFLQEVKMILEEPFSLLL